ncbi:hypothetical protein AX16_003019 [Volvariella volvacea WC 439]|nr:hypothetical protein AX16_003019 [Volvariella volvacea WC 439]
MSPSPRSSPNPASASIIPSSPQVSSIPPDSDSAPRPDLQPTQAKEAASEQPAQAANVQTETTSLPDSSPAFSPTCASSPDSGSTSLSSASNSSSASSISFVLSAPSWPSKLDASTSLRSSSAVSVSQSSPAPSPLPHQRQDQTITSNLSVSFSDFHSPLASPINNTKSDAQHDTSREFDLEHEHKGYEQHSHDEIYGIDGILSALSLERYPHNVEAVVPIELTQTLNATLSPQELLVHQQRHQQHPHDARDGQLQLPSPVPSSHPSSQLLSAATQQTILSSDIDYESNNHQHVQAAQQYNDRNQLESFHASQTDGQQEYSPGEELQGRIHVADPNPASSETPIASGVAVAGQTGLDKPFKTPNVYINGLPPHFPEDQLYALAAPFGDIRSVRTFTRHVRDSESGYGFVLFETVDAAERCITSLRRYRNLHPTFSKQIHKIPGTPYAQMHQHEDLPAPPAPSSWQKDGRENGEASFKAKLESLHDPASTNLYIEGLPLTIDEPTLGALVSPHRINSSRFFQTRLSSPPRIIAFVRLETRAAAEEVIERLHGRMVRGWNDPGCRISVRFADTNEQRELRRAERMSREGDQSPARLTLAQAALLNLRGQDLRVKDVSAPLNQYPLIGRGNRQQSDARHAGNQINLQYQDNDFIVDYSRAPTHQGMGIGLTSSQLRSQTATRSLPYSNSFNEPITLPPPASQAMDPAMAALLSTLRTNSSPFRNQTQQFALSPSRSDELYHQRQEAGTITLPPPNYARNYIDPHQVQLPPPAGYSTAGEATRHVQESAQLDYQQQQQRKRPVLDVLRRRGSLADAAGANISIGLRGQRAQAATIQIPQHGNQQVQQEYQTSPGGVVKNHLNTPMTEAEFHASGGNNEFINHTQAMINERSQAAQFGSGGMQSTVVASPSHSQSNLRISRDSQLACGQEQQRQVAGTSHQQQGMPSTAGQYTQRYQNSHLRSTTLPTKVSAVQSQYQHPRHAQHSSLSITTSTPSISMAMDSGRGGGDERGGDLTMGASFNGTGTEYAEHNHYHQAHHQRQQSHSHHRNSSGHHRDEQRQHQTHARHGSHPHAQQLRDVTPPAINATRNGVKTGVGANAHGHPSQKAPVNGGAGVRPTPVGSASGNSPRDGGAYENPAQVQFERANYARRTGGISTGTAGSDNTHLYDSDANSSSLVSPALTYSSQSPSTMSPATPFFGSFANHGDGFANTATGHHGMSPLSQNSITIMSSPRVDSGSGVPSMAVIGHGGGMQKNPAGGGTPQVGSTGVGIGKGQQMQAVIGAGVGVRGHTTSPSVSGPTGGGDATAGGN